MSQTTNVGKRSPDERIRRVASIALALMAVFLVTVVFFDARISRAVAHWPEHEHAFFHWLTEFGEGAVVLVPALVLWLVTWAAWRLTRAYWWRWSIRGVSAMSLFVFGAVGLPGLTAAILKRLFGRARPMWLDSEGVFAFSFFQPTRWDYQSFPSGHATTSLAFALAVVLLFGRRAWWVFILAGLIAFSRVVIGMHYTSDVVFGTMLGLFGAWALALNWRENGRIFARGAGWRNRFLKVLEHQWRRVRRRSRQDSA